MAMSGGAIWQQFGVKEALILASTTRAELDGVDLTFN